MSDVPTDYLQRENERLEAELTQKEHEIEELKAKRTRAEKVEDELWSHNIYLKARNKMAILAGGILSVLTGLGLFTLADMYTGLLEFTQGEMKQFIEGRIQDDITELIEEKKVEVDTKISEFESATQQLTASAQTAEQRVKTIVGKMERDILARAKGLDEKAEKLELKLAALSEETEKRVSSILVNLESSAAEAQKASKAYSVKVQQFKNAESAPEEIEQGETELSQVSADCDPHNLDDSQIALIGIKQRSERTTRVAGNGKPYFKNIFVLDVRGKDDRSVSSSVQTCILDGIDRVVYHLSPRWYGTSEIVSTKKKKNYLLSVWGWGPTQLTVDVYVIGKRDFIGYCGNILDRDLKPPGSYLSRGVPSTQGTMCRKPGERVGPI